MSPFSTTDQIRMFIHPIRKRTMKLAMNMKKTVLKFPKANRRKRREAYIYQKIKKREQRKKWENTTIIIIKIFPFIVISK